MRYFISAGEHSGDMHGADLARAIFAEDPEAEIYGMGGPLMESAGVEILHDPTLKSTIGFVEVLKNYRRFKALLNSFEGVWRQKRPDLVIWVDFGGFNLALAERAHDNGIPVLCIFSPSSWAYGQKRAVRMGQCVTQLAAVLPFETDFYRRFGVKAEYVGHPLIDRVKPAVDRETFRKELGIGDEEHLVALLPGSRRQELQRLLPPMLEAASIIAMEKPDVHFVLPVAPSLKPEEVDAIFAQGEYPHVRRIVGGSYDVMNAADLGLIASGTATLEAAILGLPIVVAYRVSPVSAAIYRTLANRKIRKEGIRIALPNLIAGDGIVPELIQEACTGENLAQAALKILTSPERLKAIYDGLIGVKETIGPPGVMPRVAKIALGLAGKQNSKR